MCFVVIVCIFHEMFNSLFSELVLYTLIRHGHCAWFIVNESRRPWLAEAGVINAGYTAVQWVCRELGHVSWPRCRSGRVCLMTDRCPVRVQTARVVCVADSTVTVCMKLCCQVSDDRTRSHTAAGCQHSGNKLMCKKRCQFIGFEWVWLILDIHLSSSSSSSWFVVVAGRYTELSMWYFCWLGLKRKHNANTLVIHTV